jgi:two-component system sensor histidine kinase TctE
VQQLLDFARLEPGVQSEAIATVDVAALAREIVGRYAAQAEAHGVDLGADAPAALHTHGSESELRSLFENVVDNALRYAPAGSAVTVSACREGPAIEIAVVDAGCGIPAAERERVFERFHRVAGDATRGTGLGLAIVKAIVERHQGSIALADSRPGTELPGLAVVIRLPALPAAPEDTDSVAHPGFKSDLSFRGSS